MSNDNGNAQPGQAAAVPVTGLNLDDLVAAQETGLKATRELRRVQVERDQLRPALAQAAQENAALKAQVALKAPAIIQECIPTENASEAERIDARSQNREGSIGPGEVKLAS
jgi:hypothetical protein